MAIEGVIFSSEKCLDYHSLGHPERAERVEKTFKYLTDQGYKIVEPSPALKANILQVHSQKHIKSVESGTFFDPDTPFFPNIFKIALLSAGGALSAMRSALEDVPAFSLMRPPGHHAGTFSGVSGFCYFNNLAVAVAEAAQTLDRIAILDIDVHHGNGTQEIFLGNDKVLFCSLHQAPLYPGTGLKSEKNCFNFPLPPGTEEKTYLKTLDSAFQEIEKFKPDLLAVSAGFDTYKNCPLANFALEIESYKKIGSRIASLGRQRFAVLEGGYSDDLPLCIENFLEGFFE